MVWNRDSPKHPGYIFIGRSTLRKIERRNDRPFERIVWGSDVPA